MKKIASVLLAISLSIVFVAGCANQTATPSANSTASSTTEQPNSSAAAQPSSGIYIPQINYQTEKTPVDVDLTEMSSTMVYAEVYNITNNPDKYMGKTIRMSGPYQPSYFDETGLYYHYVIVEDAAACCASGLEFVWSGEHVFPDDYPAVQAKIEVTGVFGSYDELGVTYYYLAVDRIVVL
ncbi:MAG: hypothetical protein LBI54_06845 [Lachnospiraceae bacterium]|jgi:uncharacterized membrane protein YcgQ (UPF0703/DUF1980 family)|nr:hypothetical protein [Lachnospiraceae bacterium]